MPLSRQKFSPMCSSGAVKLDEINRRRRFTGDKFGLIQNELAAAKKICRTDACVYATGSYGRHEASEGSDLDLFIVGLPVSNEERRHPCSNSGQDERKLSQLDEICLKAELIGVTRKLELPKFDGDGEYLRHYTGQNLVELLGKPNDDAHNTFTARLLLLLESKPLLGEDVYKSIIGGVIAAYWRDYADHKDEFVPAYFVNDILRLWRTFCVNYEARTETKPDEKKIKRRVKNYKLKHSRLLTCFSTIISLLAIYRQKRTVSPHDLVDIVEKTPTERLECILQRDDLKESHGQVNTLLAAYDDFLKRSSVGTECLMELFSNSDEHKGHMAKATKFGDEMYNSLVAVGDDSRFLRQLTV